MKKLAFTVFAALAVSFTCGFTFASGVLDVLPSITAALETQALTPMARVVDDPVAATLPAQLLTATCGQRKGNLKFSEAELNTMLDASHKDPQLLPKVCSVFSLRA